MFCLLTHACLEGNPMHTKSFKVVSGGVNLIISESVTASYVHFSVI